MLHVGDTWRGGRVADTGRRRLGVMAAALLWLPVLSGCSPFSETWRWNQKLTVEVSTPGGVRSGSAVSEVVWQERNATGNFPGSYRGEATAVDLGQGRYLFALIGEDTRYLAMRTFEPDLGADATITEDGFAAMSRIRGTRDVPAKYRPLLVTFGDIADPKTVRRVDPADLAASFGPGVTLKRITLEITDEAVTEGRVETLLTWLGPHPEPKLGPATGGTTDIPFYRLVSHGNFLRR